MKLEHSLRYRLWPIAAAASVALVGLAALAATFGLAAASSSPNEALAAPDLQVSKEDGGVVATAGSSVAYTLTITNSGNMTATGVVVTETVPAGTTFDAAASTAGWACAPDNSAGSSCSLAIGTVAGSGGGDLVGFTVTVSNPVPAGLEEVANSVQVGDDGSNGADANPGDNSDSTATPLDAAPDLQLGKDDGGIMALSGEKISYTLTFTNAGDQDSSGVIIHDVVPANTVFNAGASTPSWSCLPNANPGSLCTFAVGALGGNGAGGQVVFAVTVADPLPAGVTLVSNAATIEDDGSGGADANPDDNGDGDSTPVNPAVDLQLFKDDGGQGIVPGTAFAYTLTFTNAGYLPATGVTITETVPANSRFAPAASTAGWGCTPDLNAGSTCTLAVGGLDAQSTGQVNFGVRVAAPVAIGLETIDNAAFIGDDGAQGADANPGDNSSALTTAIAAAPDLQIAKADGGGVRAGGTLSYTLTFTNAGNQDTFRVFLFEIVPDYTSFEPAMSSPGWLCSPDGGAGSTCVYFIGPLKSNRGGQVNFAVSVDNPVPAGVSHIENKVEIGGDRSSGADANPADNVALTATPLMASPDLRIRKQDNGFTFVPGTVIDYTLFYTNQGRQGATGVFIEETVPAHTTFLPAASTPGWSCVPNRRSGSVCRLPLGELPGGGSGADVGFVVQVDSLVPDGVSQIANTAVVGDDGGNGPDAHPANNSATIFTPLARTGFLALPIVIVP